MRAMFKGCTSLTSLDLSNFNTQNTRYFTDMFKGITSIKVKVKKSIADNFIEAMSDEYSVQLDIVE